MSKADLELSESELLHLAEMSAMVLTVLGQAMPEDNDARSAAWHKLCVSILKSAAKIPSIRRHMELNPDCGYWFFKRPYVDAAFYSDVLEEFRDSTFWSELVGRLSEQALVENLGDEMATLLTDDERNERVSSYEKALWNEVNHHGLDRLVFLLPPEES